MLHNAFSMDFRGFNLGVELGMGHTHINSLNRTRV